MMTPTIGISSYESVVEVHIKLNSNAASVHSELGNDTLGIFVLTVAPAVYYNLAGIPFITPLKPGQIFVIPLGSTGPTLTALDAAHKIQGHIWKEYLAVDKALKQQLLGCVNEMYYRMLQK